MNPRNDQAALDFLATCEYHPEREGHLRVELPSIGVKRYLCDECTDSLVQAFERIPREQKKGDPLQADYSVGPDGIYFCGQLAYPDKGNER